jgi:hypothetical protein
VNTQAIPVFKKQKNQFILQVSHHPNICSGVFDYGRNSKNDYKTPDCQENNRVTSFTSDVGDNNVDEGIRQSHSSMDSFSNHYRVHTMPVHKPF